MYTRKLYDISLLRGIELEEDFLKLVFPDKEYDPFDIVFGTNPCETSEFGFFRIRVGIVGTGDIHTFCLDASGNMFYRISSLFQKQPEYYDKIDNAVSIIRYIDEFIVKEKVVSEYKVSPFIEFTKS